jgi:hypothetical protein
MTLGEVLSESSKIHGGNSAPRAIQEARGRSILRVDRGETAAFTDQNSRHLCCDIG